jgi:hypothetical protein
MNYRSVFLATTILIGEKSSTSCLIARHLDEKSRDCKQRILASSFVLVRLTCPSATCDNLGKSIEKFQRQLLKCYDIVKMLNN